MEELSGGANRLRHQRNPPPSDRFLGILNPKSTSSALPLELSEHDIFNTPSGSSSSSPTQSGISSKSIRNVQNQNGGHYGILAALNDNLKTRSGSNILPVFNHRASAPLPLSSPSSISPATSTSSRMMIPKRPPPPPPVDRMRLRLQSAPVNVPLIPVALARRVRDLDEFEEEEEEHNNGVMLPPHELVAARHSPVLANSVLEGVGRTLKGRDLRQVRNAIWRRTGFID